MDINEAASKLFDNSPELKGAAPAQQPAPATTNQPSAIKADTNANISSEQKFADAVYSTEAYRDVRLVESRGTLDEDPAEIDEQNEVHRDQMYEIGLSDTEAQEYTTLLKNADVAPPDDATLAGWKQQQDEILSRWSPDERRERLETITAWLSQSPGLAQQILDRKLQSNPRLLEVALEKSWSWRANGGGR